MMSGGGGGSAGLRYFLFDSAKPELLDSPVDVPQRKAESVGRAFGSAIDEAKLSAPDSPNPRVLKDEFGLVHDGYEVDGKEDGYRLADRLRDELGMSQDLHSEDMEYLYQADWISVHPDEAEDLTDEEFVELAEDYMEKMGWSDHRMMVVAHDHTDHKDRHLIIDRVDHTNQQTLDVDWVQNRRMDVERELEKEHKLIQVEPNQRARVGASTQNLRSKMRDGNSYDQLERFVRIKAQNGVIESKGDLMEIMDEAYLETDDHGNYVTVIDPDTNNRHRIGEDDISQIDWTNNEVEAYRESVIDPPELIRESPTEQIVDVFEDREQTEVAKASAGQKQSHDRDEVADVFEKREEVAQKFEELDDEQELEHDQEDEVEAEQEHDGPDFERGMSM